MNKILLILLFPVCIYGQLKVKDDIALVDMSTLKILNEKLEYGSHCKNTLILLQKSQILFISRTFELYKSKSLFNGFTHTFDFIK